MSISKMQCAINPYIRIEKTDEPFINGARVAGTDRRPYEINNGVYMEGWAGCLVYKVVGYYDEAGRYNACL
jgi:hypothetical protein